MDLLNNIRNMFGDNYQDEAATQDTKILAQKKAELAELKQIETFFKTEAGKSLIDCIKIAQEEVRLKLEDVDHENLIKVQANLKAIKCFILILEEKMTDIESYEDLIESISI